jgi:hypothetical protein
MKKAAFARLHDITFQKIEALIIIATTTTKIIIKIRYL